MRLPLRAGFVGRLFSGIRVSWVGVPWRRRTRSSCAARLARLFLHPNRRQIWFLTGIGQKKRIGARAIQTALGVSEKTAKRDIAGLKSNKLIKFVGTRRRGRYVLTQDA